MSDGLQVDQGQDQGNSYTNSQSRGQAVASAPGAPTVNTSFGSMDPAEQRKMIDEIRLNNSADISGTVKSAQASYVASITDTVKGQTTTTSGTKGISINGSAQLAANAARAEVRNLTPGLDENLRIEAERAAAEYAANYATAIADSERSTTIASAIELDNDPDLVQDVDQDQDQQDEELLAGREKEKQREGDAFYPDFFTPERALETGIDVADAFTPDAESREAKDAERDQRLDDLRHRAEQIAVVQERREDRALANGTELYDMPESVRVERIYAELQSMAA